MLVLFAWRQAPLGMMVYIYFAVMLDVKVVPVCVCALVVLVVVLIVLKSWFFL